MTCAPPPNGWYPRRGDVYFFRLDKLRPAVVVSTDSVNRRSRDICILPLSTSVKNVFFLFRPRLAAGEVQKGRDSWVKCDQPRLHYRHDATYPPVVTLSAKSMQIIDAALMDYLGIHHPRSNHHNQPGGGGGPAERKWAGE